MYIIAIDLGGTNLKIGLLDLGFKIRDRKTLSTANFNQRQSLIKAILDSVNNIIANNRLEKCNILGLGLGLPGPIDVEKGVVHFFPNIPGWKEVKLKRILEKRLGLSVFMDNDANLVALAEYKLGAAKGAKNAICITLGTGVGGGIIIEGNLYRGSSFAAGEIGHMPINENGPECNCGGVACLESYIGNQRIMRRAKRIFRRVVSLEELSQLAKNKNEKAIKIWNTIGRQLGIALTGIVNVFNPDCIVIGGGVANAGSVLFSKVRETILKRAMSIQAAGLYVRKGKLDVDAGLIGAALFVKEKLDY